MKVLSLLQPWASLVVLGHKRIETRPRNTSYRGQLLIHASLGKKHWKNPDVDELFKDYYNLFAPVSALPLGAIIGSVNITDTCTTNLWLPGNPGEMPGLRITTDTKRKFLCLDKQEYEMGDYSKGRWGYLLEDSLQFKEPIPAKGQLGIWNWGGDLSQPLEKMLP